MGTRLGEASRDWRGECEQNVFLNIYMKVSKDKQIRCYSLKYSVYTSAFNTAISFPTHKAITLVNVGVTLKRNLKMFFWADL